MTDVCRRFLTTSEATTTVQTRTPGTLPLTSTGRSLETTCRPSQILSESLYTCIMPYNCIDSFATLVNHFNCVYFYYIKYFFMHIQCVHFRSNMKALIPHPVLEKKPPNEWKQVNRLVAKHMSITCCLSMLWMKISSFNSKL